MPEPPPWEDIPDDAVPAAAGPLGGAEAVWPAAPVQPLVSLPVLVASEPSARMQPRSHSAPASPDDPVRLVPTEEGDYWHAVVQQLVAAEAVTALVRELALQSQLVARDDGHWLLRVERESLNQPTVRERLRAALETAGLARELSVEMGPVTDCPARRNAAAAQARQKRAQEVVMNDPYVQTLMRDYGARIVPGSIQPL